MSLECNVKCLVKWLSCTYNFPQTSHKKNLLCVCSNVYEQIVGFVIKTFSPTSLSNGFSAVYVHICTNEPQFVLKPFLKLCTRTASLLCVLARILSNFQSCYSTFCKGLLSTGFPPRAFLCVSAKYRFEFFRHLSVVLTVVTLVFEFENRK